MTLAGVGMPGSVFKPATASSRFGRLAAAAPAHGPTIVPRNSQWQRVDPNDAVWPTGPTPAGSWGKTIRVLQHVGGGSGVRGPSPGPTSWHPVGKRGTEDMPLPADATKPYLRVSSLLRKRRVVLVNGGPSKVARRDDEDDAGATAWTRVVGPPQMYPSGPFSQRPAEDDGPDSSPLDHLSMLCDAAETLRPAAVREPARPVDGPDRQCAYDMAMCIQRAHAAISRATLLDDRLATAALARARKASTAIVQNMTEIVAHVFHNTPTAPTIDSVANNLGEARKYSRSIGANPDEDNHPWRVAADEVKTFFQIYSKAVNQEQDDEAPKRQPKHWRKASHVEEIDPEINVVDNFPITADFGPHDDGNSNQPAAPDTHEPCSDKCVYAASDEDDARSS